MLTHNLGYPRIGSHRELKKACESYWAGKSTLKSLRQVGKNIRQQNWELQKEKLVDLIPSNDFSFYDQVLDMSMMVNAIPERYHDVILNKNNSELDLYFAMARGYQKDGLDITAMEMTKWFDTNYHYIVPEFRRNQTFSLFSTKAIDEFYEAKELGITTKPVFIGPVSYLLLGKEKEEGFDRIDLIRSLVPVYIELLSKLDRLHVQWIQFDEPFLTFDLSEKEKKAFRYAYDEIRKAFPGINVMIATYFETLEGNLGLATTLPINALHIDLARGAGQLEQVLQLLPERVTLSLGLIDGRNIWINNFEKSLALIESALGKRVSDRIMIAPSCSLIHTPVDLALETNEQTLPPSIKQWMAFAKQKLEELASLKSIAEGQGRQSKAFLVNQLSVQERQSSLLIHDHRVKRRTENITEADAQRKNAFAIRKKSQQELLQLPSYPTTTIGSFPQTAEVRSWRAKLKNGTWTQEQYDAAIREETINAIRWQEDIGIDVLVHGEFERNDMVEYFGEQLNGYAFTSNGWVQSYGSRCVKPPVVYGDVSRRAPMTVEWTTFAQSLTSRPVKGMLTGPVTILQWSFVRDDQPRKDTAFQIALAIRDEVLDLERAGIKIIQIDEPAIREGLPLRKSDWATYLDWAIKAFRVAVSGVRDETQIHTHMCYSEFNDIIQSIADMDADVITIECSRSQMELLDAFAGFRYPNDIGPGVYDIHSPRVPAREEMVFLMKKAMRVVPNSQLWINPDCGLKTRNWPETKTALVEMVAAAKLLRESVLEPQV